MLDDTRITLAHGNGGRHNRDLIEELFVRYLGNPDLDSSADAALLTLPGQAIAMTTDGFTVQPLEFPGGDIGALAVHGTVNDLAVAGADPHYLSVSALIEEGLTLAQLERIVGSIAQAARESGVRVVTGDTKVVPRGHGGGLYLTTTGIGTKRTDYAHRIDQITPGDVILVSGPVGDHGIAVLLAREEFGLKGTLQSDSASVLPLTRALLNCPGLKFMRDPTRGGLATVMHDIAEATGARINLVEDAIPVHDQVASVCEMLGYDPYYLACEGRVVAVVSGAQASTALCRWQALPQGQGARMIGDVLAPDSRERATVTLLTRLGGERLLEPLEDEPLPRIC